MPARIRAQRLPASAPPTRAEDPAVVQAYLEDASGSGPGRAAGVVRPEDEAAAAAFLASTRVAVLPQAARSSLTSGAVPRGEVVISVERMNRIGPVRRHDTGARVEVGPGVRLNVLQRELQEQGLYYPPVPTYQEAMVGGAVATNAGGAATFKYGVTRQWVHGLRVLLYNGDLLEIERGQARVHPGESFRIELSDGSPLSVPVTDHVLPPLKKVTAGYHAEDPLDLVDLFIGSEGTLGLIAGATLELVPAPPAQLTGLVFLENGPAALMLAGQLREAALRGRTGGTPGGFPDVRAIEWIDSRSLRLLREGGDAAKLRVAIPEEAGAALLFEVELAEATSNEQAQQVIGEVMTGREGTGRDDLRELISILDRHGGLETLELAFPEDSERAEGLRELREAVPRQVNELLARSARTQRAVRKVGGDLIVPFHAVAEMIAFYQRGFRERGLEFAIWGHLSDGNLHPNALPHNAGEVAAAEQAQLSFAQRAMQLGGCPLSEHGVGRSPLKQRLLRRFVGSAAVDRMRRIKRAIDPRWRFSPGVLFSERVESRRAPAAAAQRLE